MVKRTTSPEGDSPADPAALSSAAAARADGSTAEATSASAATGIDVAKTAGAAKSAGAATSAQAAEPVDDDGDDDCPKSSLFRWSYLWPRLTVAFVVLGTITCCGNYIMRYVCIEFAQRVVRAKVDIGAYESQGLGTQITLHEVRVANRRKPGYNLFQFRSGRVQLETGPLFRGKFVLAEARIDGLEFDTKRSDDGRADFVRLKALAKYLPDIDLPDIDLEPALQGLKSFSAAGIDVVEQRVEAEIRGTELEAINVAGRIRTHWTNQYAEWGRFVGGLKKRVKDLKGKAKNLGDNPLEQLQTLESTAREVEELVQQFQRAKRDLETLPDLARRDVAAVEAAAHRDVARLKEKYRLPPLDPKGLADHFFGREMMSHAEQIASGVRFLRQFELAPELEFEPERLRGRVIHFGTPEPLPALLVRSATISGQTTIRGLPVAFTGRVDGWTPQLKEAPGPIVVHLEGTGPVNLVLDGTLDRKSAEPIDRWRLVCTNIALPGRQVGDAKELAMQIAPGKAQVQLDLLVQGEKISGRLDFIQPQVAWQVQVAELEKQTWLAPLSQSLAGKNDVKATLLIGGNWDQPTCELSSNLADELATHFQTAWQQQGERLAGAVAAQVHQRAAAEAQALFASLGEAPQQMLGDLDGGENDLASVQQLAAQQVKQLKRLFR